MGHKVLMAVGHPYRNVLQLNIEFWNSAESSGLEKELGSSSYGMLKPRFE